MDGKKYEYHEPVQTPIAPPYAEALSLLENKKAGSSFIFDHETEFNESDINTAIENGASSMAEFKKDALITATEKSKDSDTIAKTKNVKDENEEEDATIVALQNLYMSEEAEDIDNSLM